MYRNFTKATYPNTAPRLSAISRRRMTFTPRACSPSQHPPPPILRNPLTPTEHSTRPGRPTCVTPLAYNNPKPSARKVNLVSETLSERSAVAPRTYVAYTTSHQKMHQDDRVDIQTRLLSLPFPAVFPLLLVKETAVLSSNLLV